MDEANGSRKMDKTPCSVKRHMHFCTSSHNAIVDAVLVNVSNTKDMHSSGLE